MTLVAGYAMHMQQLNVAFLVLFLRPNKWITVHLLLYLVKTAKHRRVMVACMQLGQNSYAVGESSPGEWRINRH
jgi:hypothetical protein